MLRTNLKCELRNGVPASEDTLQTRALRPTFRAALPTPEIATNGYRAVLHARDHARAGSFEFGLVETECGLVLLLDIPAILQTQQK